MVTTAAKSGYAPVNGLGNTNCTAMAHRCSCFTAPT
jgi:hypothetical protein